MSIYLTIGKEYFKNNKYTKWYFNIINKAVSRESNLDYVEKHHILPKSIFKEFKKEKWNIVELTAREHFICHLLLIKMVDNEDRKKMAYAFWGMSNQANQYQRRIASSIHYEYSKRLMQQSLSNERKGKSLEELYGNKKAAKIRIKFKKRKARRSPSRKEIESIKIRIKNAQKNNKDWKYHFKTSILPKKTCPNCQLEVDIGNYARHHGDKCKRKLIKCESCSKEFSVIPSEKRKFCSANCANQRFRKLR